MIQTTNISLIPSDNKPVINVSQFDNVSRVLRFNVFDDSGMEVPHVFDDGDTVLLNIRKNDNNIVVITGVIVSDIDPETQEVTGQYITFELTEQACACVGSNYGEVSIASGDDEVIGSCNFRLLVERSPLAGGVSSQTAIDNLTTQIEQITEEVIGENYYNKEEVNGLIDELEDSIPSKTSELENDSGFITAEDVPTKTSELENDSGFTTVDDNATVNDKTWSSEKISDELYALLPVGSASGPIASFNTALAKPLLSINVDENATKLTKCGKNLLKTNGISLVAPSDTTFSYLTKRTFQNESYCVGLSSNNYYNPGLITSYEVTNNNVKIHSQSQAYGLAIAINLKAGVTYNLSFTTIDGKVTISFYASDGSWISNTNEITSSGSFNVPDNATQCIILFRTINNDILATFTNIQIEVGSTSSTFEEYKKVVYDLPLSEMPVTYIGINNFFADVGDVSLTYKDTIEHYIDVRVQAVSNRSLSMQRTLETLEKSVTLDKSLELERGDNNDDNAR